MNCRSTGKPPGRFESNVRMQKRVIAFVINSIGFGGAERALHNILAGIGNRVDRYEVHLILLDDVPEAREMPSYVVKHVLDGRGRLPRSLFLLIGKLRRLRPALVVSLLVRANVCAAIAARLLSIPSILCERMHLGSHLDGKHRGLRRVLAKAMPRLFYRLATRVLGVSSGVTSNLVTAFGVDPARAGTIYNPYDLDRNAADAARPPEFHLPDQFILGIGRLTPAKNFAQLIEAYLEADLPYPLVILGDGSERRSLEALIARHAAGDRILLPGYARNPFPIMAKAHFYVSASLNEGFPNAMAEAMALGTPVVVTDCPSGPAEILASVPKLNPSEPVLAEFGILVPERSVAALAEGMRLMADPRRRDHYSRQARRRILDFRSEKIAEDYWGLFDRLAE